MKKITKLRKERKRTLVLYYSLVLRQNIAVKRLINNNRTSISDFPNTILILMNEVITMNFLFEKN